MNLIDTTHQYWHQASRTRCFHWLVKNTKHSHFSLFSSTFFLCFAFALKFLLLRIDMWKVLRSGYINFMVRWVLTSEWTQPHTFIKNWIKVRCIGVGVVVNQILNFITIISLISDKKSINKLLKQNSKVDLQGEITSKYFP